MGTAGASREMRVPVSSEACIWAVSNSSLIPSCSWSSVSSTYSSLALLYLEEDVSSKVWHGALSASQVIIPSPLKRNIWNMSLGFCDLFFFLELRRKKHLVVCIHPIYLISYRNKCGLLRSHYKFYWSLREKKKTKHKSSLILIQ